ncbi:MAG: hypothetical protein L0Y39_03765 [Methylococcaceae bacterium]|nr:hypothetical protein [Methylococcaceae bacterium]
MMTVQLDDELAAKFSLLAGQAHIQPEQLIRNVLQNYLDVQTAEKILEDIERGDEGLVDWEDVKKGLHENMVD